VGTVGRKGLVVPIEDEDALQAVRSELAQRVGFLRRSIHIRHVDAGSDGSEEWEVAALTNPVYDVQRLGIYFTASPRHADLLLVTGVGTAGMAGPLLRTYDAMPHPKVVLAAGTDAVSGGLLHPSYAGADGIETVVPVDVFVPGSPPSPFSLLHGILVGIGLLGESGDAG
jgi:Ni,Fe-hydrogenase III small subunit